jgi:hypothetical protein
MMVVRRALVVIAGVVAGACAPKAPPQQPAKQAPLTSEPREIGVGDRPSSFVLFPARPPDSPRAPRPTPGAKLVMMSVHCEPDRTKGTVCRPATDMERKLDWRVRAWLDARYRVVDAEPTPLVLDAALHFYDPPASQGEVVSIHRIGTRLEYSRKPIAPGEGCCGGVPCDPRRARRKPTHLVSVDRVSVTIGGLRLASDAGANRDAALSLLDLEPRTYEARLLTFSDGPWSLASVGAIQPSPERAWGALHDLDAVEPRSPADRAALEYDRAILALVALQPTRALDAIRALDAARRDRDLSPVVAHTIEASWPTLEAFANGELALQPPADAIAALFP